MPASSSIDKRARAIAQAIADDGGRAVIVGGFVRDQLLGAVSKDYDLEVYGLTLDALEAVLGRFGSVIKVGRAFGVLKVKGLDVDVSIPRRDNKTGAGHRGFVVELDPTLTFEAAARRRDLTINSIGLDPLTGERLDPYGGARDVERRVLRATDPAHFAEDPLRALRVAQFAARFEMTPDAALIALCAGLDLAELPGERMLEEFRKLMLKGRRPSLGLAFLRDADLLRFFPELAALIDVPQDPRYHPEGDVWTHTLMVVDAAAAERTGDDDDDLAVAFAALCHDFGKPATTVVDGDRVRAHQHEIVGLPLTEAFLERLRAPRALVKRVCGLVRDHLAPPAFIRDGAGAPAYRRLARRLAEAGVDARLLARIARADRLGRGVRADRSGRAPDDAERAADDAGRAADDAERGAFPEGDRFVARAAELTVDRAPPPRTVSGRHLIARGLEPGPNFAAILARCREVEDETGWDDPDRVLDAALSPTTE